MNVLNDQFLTIKIDDVLRTPNTYICIYW